MLTPGQCRATRGWLNWTQAELAEHANVGLSTVRDFESEVRTPIQNNLAAIRRALEEAGASAFLKATDDLKASKAAEPKKVERPAKPTAARKRSN